MTQQPITTTQNNARVTEDPIAMLIDLLQTKNPDRSYAMMRADDGRTVLLIREDSQEPMLIPLPAYVRARGYFNIEQLLSAELEKAITIDDLPSSVIASKRVDDFTREAIGRGATMNYVIGLAEVCGYDPPVSVDFERGEVLFNTGSPWRLTFDGKVATAEGAVSVSAANFAELATLKGLKKRPTLKGLV